MADYPTTDINSQLIGAGLNPSNPSGTYVDFAEQLARNQQQQALQEQAIARAKELTTQSQIQTQQEQAAQEAGANVLLENTMTPEQAVASLRIIIKSKGLPITEDDIATWASTLPARVNRQEVEAFASRFARETTRAGQPSEFTTDQNILVPVGKSATDLGLTYFPSENKDDSEPSDGKNSAHVPDDGMYQVVYDNQGVIQKFIPGGKELVDQSAKNASKEAQANEKTWAKLDAAINQFLKSTRGNQITTSIYRADRALNELAGSETLTPQVLSFIEKDLSGIFQGGVPPQAGMASEDFTTTLQKINGLISKYTGVQGYLHSDLGNQRDYLLGLLTRLWESSVDILKALISSEQSGYQGIISQDPDRWAKMVADKTAAATAGLSATAQSEVNNRKMSTDVETIPGVTGNKTPAASTGKKQNRLNLDL